MSMSMSVRLSPEDKALFQNYAKMHGVSMSELVRRSVLEWIEDDYDLQAYERAKREFEADPVTYTLDEVEKALNLK